MSETLRKIFTFLLQLLDLLIDAIYLLVWAILNYFVLRGLNKLHPSLFIMVLLWSAQGAFAAFALAIIVLHLYHDLMGSAEEHAGLKGILEKLKDISRHFVSLIMLLVLLTTWAVMNAILHLGLDMFRSQASTFVDVSAWILEGLFALRTLWLACKEMSKELKKIRGRLFPQPAKAEG